MTKPLAPEGERLVDVLVEIERLKIKIRAVFWRKIRS